MPDVAISTSQRRERGPRNLVQAQRRSTGAVADQYWNLTITAIERQLGAMDNFYGYDVGVRNQATSRTLNFYGMSADWVLDERTIGFLRARNAGLPWRDKAAASEADEVTCDPGKEAVAAADQDSPHHIYIRPAKNDASNLVLADDWKREHLAAIRAQGWEPALVIETSAANFQAWFQLPFVAGGYPMPEQRAAVARYLAAVWGADPGSAEASHYGRLAGFSNVKPERRKPDGKFFFGLVAQDSGAICAASLLEAAAAWTREQALVHAELREETRKLAARESTGLRPSARGGNSENVGEFIKRLTSLCAKRQLERRVHPDNSSAEWFAVCAALARGFPMPDVVDALAAATTHERKGPLDDYPQRTVAKAETWLAMKVQGLRWEQVAPTLVDAAKQRHGPNFDGRV